MNYKKAGVLIGLLISVLFIVSAFFGCKKSGPTIAIVTVVDSAQRPVANAAVTLWQDTSHSQQTGLKLISGY
jgi:hypothetical protein